MKRDFPDPDVLELYWAPSLDKEGEYKLILNPDQKSTFIRGRAGACNGKQAAPPMRREVHFAAGKSAPTARDVGEVELDLLEQVEDSLSSMNVSVARSLATGVGAATIITPFAYGALNAVARTILLNGYGMNADGMGFFLPVMVPLALSIGIPGLTYGGKAVKNLLGSERKTLKSAKKALTKAIEEGVGPDDYAAIADGNLEEFEELTAGDFADYRKALGTLKSASDHDKRLAAMRGVRESLQAITEKSLEAGVSEIHPFYERRYRQAYALEKALDNPLSHLIGAVGDLYDKKAVKRAYGRAERKSPGTGSSAEDKAAAGKKHKMPNQHSFAKAALATAALLGATALPAGVHSLEAGQSAIVYDGAGHYIETIESGKDGIEFAGRTWFYVPETPSFTIPGPLSIRSLNIRLPGFHVSSAHDRVVILDEGGTHGGEALEYVQGTDARTGVLKDDNAMDAVKITFTYQVTDPEAYAKARAEVEKNGQVFEDYLGSLIGNVVTSQYMARLATTDPSNVSEFFGAFVEMSKNDNPQVAAEGKAVVDSVLSQMQSVNDIFDLIYNPEAGKGNPARAMAAELVSSAYKAYQEELKSIISGKSDGTEFIEGAETYLQVGGIEQYYGIKVDITGAQFSQENLGGYYTYINDVVRPMQEGRAENEATARGALAEKAEGYVDSGLKAAYAASAGLALYMLGSDVATNVKRRSLKETINDRKGTVEE